MKNRLTIKSCQKNLLTEKKYDEPGNIPASFTCRRTKTSCCLLTLAVGAINVKGDWSLKCS